MELRLPLNLRNLAMQISIFPKYKLKYSWQKLFSA